VTLRDIYTEEAKINAGTGKAYSYKFNDFVTTAQWDYYRFNYISVKIVPRTAPSHPGDTNGRSICAAAVDWDDSTAPASLEKMQNLQNVKLFRSDQTFYIKWKPRIEVDVPTTNATESPAMLKAAPWLNSAFNTVVHRGLKVWLDNQGDKQSAVWDIIVTANISLKNPLIEKAV
jgi:hypothetical protein